MSLTPQDTLRINQLTRLGMQFDGQHYFGTCEHSRDFNVHFTEVLCDTKQQWSKKILKLKQELRKRKRNTSV